MQLNLKSLKLQQEDLSGFSCSSNWLEMDPWKSGSRSSVSTSSTVVEAQLQQSANRKPARLKQKVLHEGSGEMSHSSPSCYL